MMNEKWYRVDFRNKKRESEYFTSDNNIDALNTAKKIADGDTIVEVWSVGGNTEDSDEIELIY